MTTAGRASTAALDYLQRTGTAPNLPANGSRTAAPPHLRRLLRVTGIGGPTKPGPVARPEAFVSPMARLHIGLSGLNLPFAFVLLGRGAGLDVRVGTWSPEGRENADAAVLDERITILETVLRGLYPWTSTERVTPTLAGFERGGISLGIPTMAAPDDIDGRLPVDGLVRSLDAGGWAVVVLAEPVAEPVLATLRHQLINESRSVEAAAAVAATVASPLTRHYLEQIGMAITSLTPGQATGAWRVSTYLLGTGRPTIGHRACGGRCSPARRPSGAAEGLRASCRSAARGGLGSARHRRRRAPGPVPPSLRAADPCSPRRSSPGSRTFPVLRLRATRSAGRARGSVRRSVRPGPRSALGDTVLARSRPGQKPARSAAHRPWECFIE